MWVTGASRGIGAAIAASFAAAGAQVILTGRNLDALRRNARAIEKSGRRASFLRCDVESEQSVFSTQRKILGEFGRIDVLVNNAGVTYFKSFAASTIREYDHVMRTNIRGGFLCAKSVLPGMLRRKSGTIINIISVSATTTFKDSSVYSASKAGMLALSRCLRAEVRNKGVRIIDVLPGAVETSMWEKRERKKYGKKMMQPSDVAEIVVSVVQQPQRVLTEEIVIRPIKGDL